MANKICKKCSSEFSGAHCRVCANAYAARYREANRERLRLASAAARRANPAASNEAWDKWRAANADKVKAAAKAWRKAHPGKYKEAAAAYHAAHADKIKARHAAWHVANFDKVKERGARYRSANREKVIATAAKYRAENKEKIRAATTLWRSKNLDYLRLVQHRRRARKRGSAGVLSVDLKDKLFKLQKGKCPCCGLALGRNYHLDHIMPLARGGLNTDSNIQLLRAVCNLRKNAKHPADFMREKGFLI